jgi:hypothetical protein
MKRYLSVLLRHELPSKKKRSVIPSFLKEVATSSGRPATPHPQKTALEAPFIREINTSLHSEGCHHWATWYFEGITPGGLWVKDTISFTITES